MKKILLLGAAVLLLAAGCSQAKQPENNNSNSTNGTTGMSHGTPNTGSMAIQNHGTYSLNILSSLNSIQPGQSINLTFNIKDEQGNILKGFQVTHEKLLHFIVVRKDLEQFQHIHPDLNNSTGEFSVAITFPTDGPYRMFADFAPKDAQMGSDGMPVMITLNQDVAVGDSSKFQAVALKPDSSILKTVNGYNINYNFPKDMKAQTAVEYGLIIEKENEDVKLENYLSAKGHSVILRQDNLDYIHAHAQDMNHGGSGAGTMNHEMSGDSVTFDATFPEPGIYKIFTQFQIKGKVITSDYTIQVK